MNKNYFNKSKLLLVSLYCLFPLAAQADCDSGGASAAVTDTGAVARTTEEVYAETGKCIPQSSINDNAGKVFWATKGAPVLWNESSDGTFTRKENHINQADTNSAMGWDQSLKSGLALVPNDSAPTVSYYATSNEGAAFGGSATVISNRNNQGRSTTGAANTTELYDAVTGNRKPASAAEQRARATFIPLNINHLNLGGASGTAIINPTAGNKGKKSTSANGNAETAR